MNESTKSTFQKHPKSNSIVLKTPGTHVWHYTQHASKVSNIHLSHSHLSMLWVPLRHQPLKAIWMSPNASAILDKRDNSRNFSRKLSPVWKKASLRLAQKITEALVENCATLARCSRIQLRQRKICRISKGNFAKDTVHTSSKSTRNTCIFWLSEVWFGPWRIVLEEFSRTWNVLKFTLSLNHVSLILHALKTLPVL